MISRTQHETPSLRRVGAASARRSRWLCASLLALASGSMGWGHSAQAGEPAAPASPAVLRNPAVMAPRAAQAGMLAITRAGQRLVAVGERGIVLWSDDQGQHWQQARVPVQATLTAVRFANAKVGWAVGHLGVVLRTDDGGQSWNRQLDGTQVARRVVEEARAALGDEAAERAGRFIEEGPDKPFFDIACADAQRVWVAGAYGLLLASEDGGATWRSLRTRIDNKLGVHLYAVRWREEAGQSRLFVAGEQGLLARSDDAGQHFTLLPSPYKGSFFGLLDTRAGALLAYGLRGNVFRSTDAGASWQHVATDQPVGVSAALELDDARLVLLAQNGDLLVSDDGGATLRRTPAARALPAAGLVHLGRDDVLLASLRGLQRAALR